MKIQYEIGDKVFERGQYGGESYEVVKLYADGVGTLDRFGDSHVFMADEIEASPKAVLNATVVPPAQDKPSAVRDELVAQVLKLPREQQAEFRRWAILRLSDRRLKTITRKDRD